MNRQIVPVRRAAPPTGGGVPQWMLVTLAAVEAAGLLASGAVILRMRRRARRHAAEIAGLSHLALVDSLTGLRNRRAFDEELGRALGTRARGVVEARLALAMIDVRGLKNVNDTMGHQAGDRRLVRLSEVLRESIRESDSVYRLGGDEFMIILPGQGAREARRLMQRLNTRLAGDGIDVAAGIAEAAVTIGADALVGRADRALIAAKRGPEAVVVWTPGVDRSHPAHGPHLPDRGPPGSPPGT